MRRLAIVLGTLLPILGACATGTYGGPAVDRPTLSGTLPTDGAPVTSLAREDDGSRSSALPIGIGFSASPSTFLFGLTYDIPLDKDLTVGPSAQFGFDDKTTLITPTLQLKYFLPAGLGDDGGRPKLQPYFTAGIGMAYLDQNGKGSDTGLLLDGGAGFRYLTGEKYRLGTEARINLATGKVNDERFWFSWEVLQVILDF